MKVKRLAKICVAVLTIFAFQGGIERIPQYDSPSHFARSCRETRSKLRKVLILEIDKLQKSKLILLLTYVADLKPYETLHRNSHQ